MNWVGLGIDCRICYQRKCGSSATGHIYHWFSNKHREWASWLDDPDTSRNFQLAICKICGWDMTRYYHILSVLEQTMTTRRLLPDVDADALVYRNGGGEALSITSNASSAEVIKRRNK